MMARLGWWAALAVLAVVAAFAQIDRSARFAPLMAGAVPAPFQGFAAQRVAERAIVKGQPEAALAATANLLALRPLPAEHLTLHSQAAALSGDKVHTLAALEAATRRGWREPIAQVAAARAALAANAEDGAAQRVAALLATGQMPEMAMTLAGELIARPAGRAAMARQLVDPSHWRGNFITIASARLEPENYARTLALAQAEGARLPCDRLAIVATGYGRAGLGEQLARFWPGSCDPAGR